MTTENKDKNTVLIVDANGNEFTAANEAEALTAMVNPNAVEKKQHWLTRGVKATGRGIKRGTFATGRGVATAGRFVADKTPAPVKAIAAGVVVVAAATTAIRATNGAINKVTKTKK